MKNVALFQCENNYEKNTRKNTKKIREKIREKEREKYKKVTLFDQFSPVEFILHIAQLLFYCFVAVTTYLRVV